MGKKLEGSKTQCAEDISGLDERSMIREQDRLAREKKKRKNRRKKRIGSAVALVLAACGIWYFFRGRNLLVREEETSVKIMVSSGQEVQYARITDIKGNEITYVPAEAVEEEEGTDAAGGAAGTDAAGRNGGIMDSFTYDGVAYRLTDQAVTTQIPVGTEVTTKLGTVTTFTRLASGDCVALVTEQAGEEQVIVGVYIIG